MLRFVQSRVARHKNANWEIRKKAAVFSLMQISAHVCRQIHSSEPPPRFYSTWCIKTWLLIELKYSLHFKQETYARVTYVFAKMTKNYWSVPIQLVPPEPPSPQTTLLKNSVPKTLSRSSTHITSRAMRYGSSGQQIAFFFPPSWIEWKLFIEEFQTCQKHFAWKIKKNTHL